MECLNCGKPVEQTPGKRAKQYCDADCRQKHWLKKKKESKPPARSPGRPPKKAVNESIVYDGIKVDHEKALASKIDFKPTTAKSYDVEKLKNYTHDEPAMYQEAEVISSELKLPTDPMELKRMAEAGVPDLVAFKKHVASIKMTAGQRAMIYSKLK